MRYLVEVKDGGMWRRVATSRSLEHAFVWMRAFAVSSSARILDESGDTVAMVAR